VFSFWGVGIESNETGSHYVAQAGLELLILLSQPGIQICTAMPNFMLCFLVVAPFGGLSFPQLNLPLSEGQADAGGLPFSLGVLFPHSLFHRASLSSLQRCARPQHPLSFRLLLLQTLLFLKFCFTTYVFSKDFCEVFLSRVFS
jgi:hypothetical protein